MSAPLPVWVEPDAVIPDERQCRDCVNLERCGALFGVNPDNRWCDWSPHRFRQRAAAGGAP